MPQSICGGMPICIPYSSPSPLVCDTKNEILASHQMQFQRCQPLNFSAQHTSRNATFDADPSQRVYVWFNYQHGAPSESEHVTRTPNQDALPQADKTFQLFYSKETFGFSQNAFQEMSHLKWCTSKLPNPVKDTPICHLIKLHIKMKNFESGKSCPIFVLHFQIFYFSLWWNIWPPRTQK